MLSVVPVITLGVVVLTASVYAQAPAVQRRPALRPSLAQVVVRDRSGNPLDGVRVGVAGPVTSEANTDAAGVVSVALPSGSYRLRFEREDFITLEREVTVKSGQPLQVEVALDAARPAVPPPLPAAVVAPRPIEPLPPPATAAAIGLPSEVSIPAFLDKNFIGREPLKESVLGCTSGGTTRLLQLREAMAAHTHGDVDEVLYVVAGDGAVYMGSEATVVSAGSLAVIPRGLAHAIERRGKNPLIVLSTLSGVPCRGLEAARTARAK
jgi:Cupin domain/Carboxypeptidase regulatory-like domain